MLHGVGTVGAAGGWLQGGGLGWGQERLWGLGVDQVLEIELVLADGRHIKFYPSEWEVVDGYMYPKTTKVEGLCNTNIFSDESMWVWGPCEDPAPPFEDLWFAVRGGGGGTYGVVTSVKLQLHENIPYYVFSLSETVAAEYAAALAELPTDEQELVQLYAGYCAVNWSLDYLFNPLNIQVTRDQSNHCGSPSFYPFAPVMVCLGEDAGTAVEMSYKLNIEQCTTSLLPEYPELIQMMVDAYSTIGPFDSLISFMNYDSGAQINVPGQLLDDGPSILPQRRPYLGDMGSLNVPESYLIQNREDAIEAFLYYGASGEHVTGGNVAIAQDQMNAVPIPERQSGFSSATFQNSPTEFQNRMLSAFLKQTVEAGDPFPGITEVNHIPSFTYGPLKSDMTKVCPTTYSSEQKDEECYSFQESIWGVELTRRLEQIKYAVDPDHLFKCYGCIEPRNHVKTDNPTRNPTYRPTTDCHPHPSHSHNSKTSHSHNSKKSSGHYSKKSSKSKSSKSGKKRRMLQSSKCHTTGTNHDDMHHSGIYGDAEMDSNNDERVRRNKRRRRFPTERNNNMKNGIDSVQEYPNDVNASNNNDIDDEQITRKRKRRRFPN